MKQHIGVNFGHALEALKKGMKVKRCEWKVEPGKCLTMAHREPYHNAILDLGIEFLPHIDMWTFDSHGKRTILPGWVPSQIDMLAEDWVIVEY